MNEVTFNYLLENLQSKSVDVLRAKSKEYATADKLHNFKVAAGIQNTTPVRALGGMMAKHTVSVYDLINKHDRGETISLDVWQEKITDSVNYLYLLWALIHEEGKA